MNTSVGLKVDGLVSGYGETVVLDGLSFEMPPGGTLAVLGRNGVGKTTLLTTLMGITTRHAGTIRLGDMPIEGLPIYRRAQLGLGYVPQEREIFPSLTVEENLAVSVLPGGWDTDKVYELFPRLKERRRNTGNRLSGGEQQMLAVARALVGAPIVLLLDEPLEGQAPIVIESLFETLIRIRDETGLTIILIEQKAELALSFAKDCIVIDRGRIVHRGPSDVLKADAALQHRLLGVAGEH
ncbi:MAG TPA: ABC transporter ATP-binding protein [Xanthobacteraceae bacterium]|nr:ABC transporter ATP-binding protein [Xanthobacteraceae bacterium]